MLRARGPYGRDTPRLYSHDGLPAVLAAALAHMHTWSALAVVVTIAAGALSSYLSVLLLSSAAIFAAIVSSVARA